MIMSNKSEKVLSNFFLDSIDKFIAKKGFSNT